MKALSCSPWTVTAARRHGRPGSCAARQAPRIPAWERGGGTGKVMFMLHADVGNVAGGGA
jgi:hypothetical protein